MTRLLRRTRPDRAPEGFDLPAIIAETLGDTAERTARLRNPATLIDEVTVVLREGWRALDRIETVVLARESAALTQHLSYEAKQQAAKAFRTLHPLPDPPDLRPETVATLLAAGPWDAELLSRSEALAARAAAVLSGLPPTTATGKTTSRVKVDAALHAFAVAVRDLTARLDRIDRHTAKAQVTAAAREDSAAQERMSHARKTLAQYGIEAS